MRNVAPGHHASAQQKNDPSSPLRAAPAPEKHGGGLDHRRSKQRAKKRSTLDPARRPRKRAPVSLRLGHWERGWRVAGGRFAVWVGCVVRTEG